MRIEPHGFGVHGDGTNAIMRKIGKIAAVQPNGHCDFGSARAVGLVPRRGLEPPRLAALVPETSASTNSATWALRDRYGAGLCLSNGCARGMPTCGAASAALYSISSIRYSPSVPIPKFARARGSLDANFGIKGTLATL